MSDRKALAREIAKRKPARFVVVKPARMQRTQIEGERGRRGQDLMEYEAAIRFVSWHSKSGVDL
jgi:hypothetical protein